MSKAAAIRLALADGPKTAIDLQSATGIHDVGPHIQPMVKNGSVIRTGERGAYVYELVPADQRTNAKKTKRPRRLKGFKAAAREKAAAKKALKKVIRRALQKPAAPSVAELARENYLATQEQLIELVKERVDGLNDDEAIGPILAAHERARQIYQAAQS